MFSEAMALDRLVYFQKKGCVVVLASFDDLSLFIIGALNLSLWLFTQQLLVQGELTARD